MAARFGTPAQPLIDTCYCESKFNPRALNKNDPNGGSKGVCQFQQKTFDHYAPLAGIEHPDVWNPMDNIQTAAYMFSKGQQHQWSCYKGGDSV